MQTWSFDQWEEMVRSGRVAPDALVRFPPVTGEAFRPAGELEMYRSLRDDAHRAWLAATGSAPILTALLVGVQVRIFWWARLPEVRGPLVDHFTSFTPEILEDHELWRMLSMGLLQVDWMHLALNMMWLAYVGWNLERTLGRVQVAVLYAFAVLVGSAFSMFGSPWTPSLGASGGVFGLVAAATTFGLVRSDLLRGRLSRGFGVVMLPYLVLMFWSGLRNQGVDNWCHFGGIVSGGLLGMLLDPPTLERTPGWNRRVWAVLGAVSVGLWLALGALGPRIEPLVDVIVARSRTARQRTEVVFPEHRELAHDVPAGWRSGRGLALRSSWCSPAGDRCFGARTDVSATFLEDATPRVEDLAVALREDWPQVVIDEPEPTSIAGWPGLHVVARVTRAGEPLLLEWWGAVRGNHVLEVAWQVEERRASSLAPLRDRLLASVVWSDPEELVRAAEAFERPTTRSREDYALALAGVGEVERALALHDEVLRGERAREPERLVAMLRTLAAAGAAVSAPEAWWSRALVAADDPSVLSALADAMDAAGRPWEARAVLELAWERWPGERSLGRARRARGMTRTLDPLGRPWALRVDPLTRQERPDAAIAQRLALGLDLATISAEAVRLREEHDALLTRAARGVEARDRGALDDLVVLASGEWAEDSAIEERRRAVAELLRALDGAPEAPTWPDRRLLDAASAQRDWLSSEVADERGTP